MTVTHFNTLLKRSNCSKFNKKMIRHIYDIEHFDWDVDNNTFKGNYNELYDSESHNLNKFPFSNGKRQFFIKNYKTSGFRRFRFNKEINNTVYEYHSEDGIKCHIFLK